mmetsp:Transcript_89194/g.158084  ORF Transcript_89194/g.158084 Transcript_89194/m.158084 type:complete len:211 (+) Transcript_89194:61-693(+)
MSLFVLPLLAAWLGCAIRVEEGVEEGTNESSAGACGGTFGMTGYHCYQEVKSYNPVSCGRQLSYISCDPSLYVGEAKDWSKEMCGRGADGRLRVPPLPDDAQAKPCCEFCATKGEYVHERPEKEAVGPPRCIPEAEAQSADNYDKFVQAPGWCEAGDLNKAKGMKVGDECLPGCDPEKVGMVKVALCRAKCALQSGCAWDDDSGCEFRGR